MNFFECQNTIISNYFFLYFFFTNPLQTKGQQEPLVRRSSQPKKSPVAAEAPEAVAPAAAPTAGAAAVASPSPPVTSPEVGTDSEAAKGNFSKKIEVHFYPHMIRNRKDVVLSLD